MPPLPIGALICVATLYSVILIALRDALPLAYVSIPAQRRLLNPLLPWRAILSAPIRRLLVTYLPVLVCMEALGLLTLSGAFDLLWIVPAAFALFTLAQEFFSARISRWIYHATPLDRTAWAPLAPRLRAWSDRAGVSLQSIYVVNAESFGRVRAAMSGQRRYSLFLADLLLEHTDWRQQDVLAAAAMASARTGLLRTVSILVYLPVPLALTAMTRLLAHWPLSTVDLTNIPVILGIILAGGLTWWLTVYVYLLTLALLRLQARGQRVQHLLLEATGDPLALLVLNHTSRTLERRLAPLAPSALLSAIAWRSEESAASISHRLLQPGPRAPWADDRVPARFPYSSEDCLITTSLEAAPPPAPLPTQPYLVLVP